MQNQTPAVAVLSRISGREAPLPFLPDLTLWHKWHAARATLPSQWKGMGIPEICRAIGVPFWRTERPWRIELPGIRVETTEADGSRVTRWETPSGTLQARWTLGPDGDWWQTEYPVKAASDLAAAMDAARARRYVAVPVTAGPEPDGITALDLPMRPYADVLANMLGWSEGMMLFLEEPEPIREMIDVLDAKLQALAIEVARIPGPVVLCPDNLDGMFVSPPAFEEHLLESYRKTAEILHASGKLVVVHGGGVLKGLLPGLGRSGIDCVEGVCGPPQSDAGLRDARRLAGPGPSLWGGIAQDALLPATDEAGFLAALESALAEARGDPRAILGVADKVPVEAVPERLERIARRVAEAR